jgi:hypothetical protein
MTAREQPPESVQPPQQDRVTDSAAADVPTRRERPKPWDHGMLRLPIPLGDGRRAYVLAPQDGLTADECARIANAVAEWHQVGPEDGEPE